MADGLFGARDARHEMTQGISGLRLQERIQRRWVSLKNERSSWWDHWKDITDHIAPNMGKYNPIITDRGRKKQQKIIDSTGRDGLRTLAAGMMSGLSSPARPWFRLAPPDRAMLEYQPVKMWLQTVEEILRAIMAKSNFYNAMIYSYYALGGFGTNFLYRERDFDDVVRFYPYVIGQYCIAEDETMRVRTAYREFAMTCEQIVGKFGMDAAPTSVRSNYDSSSYDKQHVVMHAIEENKDYEAGSINPARRRFRSVYSVMGGTTGKYDSIDGVVQVRGYDTFPGYGTRWELQPGDVYGHSPGMDALGDVKQLQQAQRDKSEGITKQIKPPMKAPPSMKGKRTTILPGGLTYDDGLIDGSGGFQPAFEVKPDINGLAADIAETQMRVRRALYTDLFAMMIESDRKDITAYEVAVKQQEKLVLLGPVLQRLNSEFFDVLIDDLFDMAMAAGIIPPPPQELQGTDLDIEYISLLQQAQQAVGAGAIDRLAAFVNNNAAVQPNVRDKFDYDQATDKYGQILGVDAGIVRSDDEVKKKREADAAAAAQAAQVEQTNVASQTVKNLSDADLEGSDVLPAMQQGL